MVASDATGNQRNAERSRSAILDAALIEFGTRGFSGARTAAIAARAGVNTQLITYYFGGKQGVMNELRRRWASNDDQQQTKDETFRATVASYLESVLDNAEWSKLVLWRALGDNADAEIPVDYAERMSRAVTTIRARQRIGELTPDVSPEFIVLLSYLVTFAPLALPHHLRGLLGADPMGSGYREWVLDELMILLRAQHI